VIFGELVNPKLATITDLDAREVLIFAPLIISTLYLGFQPNVVFNLTAASVDQLVATYRAAIGG
jgi:NADH-quinone oxidoreductase subunit M